MKKLIDILRKSQILTLHLLPYICFWDTIVSMLEKVMVLERKYTPDGKSVADIVIMYLKKVKHSKTFMIEWI